MDTDFHVGDRVRVIREGIFKGREGVILKANDDDTFVVKHGDPPYLPVKDLISADLEKLPQQKTGGSLTQETIELLRRWIAAYGEDHGLAYPKHCFTCETKDLMGRLEKSQ